jgi:predicted kinase
MDAHQAVRDVDGAMPETPFARPEGSLLVMVGLPGTGKSMIVERLIEFIPAAVIGTDTVRRYMRQFPTYTAAEMMFVYQVCHQVIERRLNRGQRVIFDGTNHAAARRQQLFEIARKHNAPLAVCQVQASEEVIRQRLMTRKSGDRRDGDMSDAGWSVYQWMVSAQEPIVHDHLILDTTNSPADQLAHRLGEYWLGIEQEAGGDGPAANGQGSSEF